MYKNIIILVVIITLIVAFAVPVNYTEGFCANCGKKHHYRGRYWPGYGYWFNWYNPYYYYVWDYYAPLPCVTDVFGSTRCY